MPRGKGTYGSKRGRPAKKAVKKPKRVHTGKAKNGNKKMMQFGKKMMEFGKKMMDYHK
tara:strand:+ start:98 stop:271 length:174 start_codon:yes stop_codon:yes gene_type:complete